MTSLLRKLASTCLALGLAGAAAIAASADAYPSKPIRIIVGYSAGGIPLPGPTEQFSRLIKTEAARYGQLIREAGIQPD